MSDPDLLLSLCAPAGYDPDSCKIASCIKAALELRDPTLALELLSLNVDPAFLRQSANYILRYAAEFGYTAVLERLAELGLDGRDASANNNSALRLAALFDKPDVVRVLAKRFNVREYLSETVLCTMFTDASMNGNLEILELVYELFDGRGNVAGGNIPVDVINYGCHVAIECGHINVLEWMRDRFKFQLDDRTVFGFCTRDPSFARAAGNGKLAMLKHLVAQLELTLDHMRDTCAFQRAAEGGHLDVLKFFVSLGFDVEDVRENRKIALRDAICKGHADVLELFADLGATRGDLEGFTWAIVAAATKGYARALKVLVDRFGLGPGYLGNEYTDVLRRAERELHTDVVNVLVEHFAPEP